MMGFMMIPMGVDGDMRTGLVGDMDIMDGVWVQGGGCML